MDKKLTIKESFNLGKGWNLMIFAILAMLVTNACKFRKNCASVPEERSAIPLQTEQSSTG